MQGIYEQIRDQQSSIYYRKSNNCCLMHFHKQIEILYIVEGEVEVHINNEIFQMLPGDFVFSDALDVHAYKPNTAVSEVMAIPIEYLKDVMSYKKDRTFTAHYLPKCKDTLRIHTVFKKLIPATNSLLILGLVNELFYEIFSIVGLSKKVQHLPNLLRDILVYLEDHCSEDLTLNKVADTFAYSPTHFSHIFSENFSVHFCDYINQLRLTKLLTLKQLNPHEKMTKLAFEVGFSSLPTFYRAFSKAFHQSPRDFFS